MDAHQQANKENPIEWHNFNYPPLIRLYHYQTNGIKQPALGVIKKMSLAANLILAISVINLLNQIIQVSSSDCILFRNRQIFYSIFDIFIWPSCAHVSFYYGLYGILQEPGKKHVQRIRFYKFSQAALIILWFTFSIISTGSKDGWMKFGTFEKCANEVNIDGNNSFGFVKFLTVIEIFLYYTAILLGVRCVYKIEFDERVTKDPFEDQENQQVVEQNEMGAVPNTENV